jgi:ectoine hydroxylase-related dioxygenase (phytanoyl-CoA dioxygenase family)
MAAVDVFKLRAPPADFKEVFDRDGCYVFESCMTDDGIAAVEHDMAGTLQTQAWGFGRPDESAAPGSSDTFGMGELSMLVRGPVDAAPESGVSLWPAPGSASFQLIDNEFVLGCVREAMGGSRFHFCHCAYGYRLGGAGGMGFHQDHHHWNHEHPVNIAEREKYYIQLLYYPNGFARGDGSLRFIPRSHTLSPPEANEWVNAGPARETGQHSNPSQPGWEVAEPLLPPGSMVLIDARMYHSVYDKPEDSAVPYRTYLNFIFKQEGPPHRFTQVRRRHFFRHLYIKCIILPRQLRQARDKHRESTQKSAVFSQPIPACYPRGDPIHDMLFEREPWSEDTWASWQQPPRL